jgi:RNA polymerase sigma-70 factor (ECF subfamily)
VEDPLARTVRLEGARILATLVRTVGDLGIAEDAVQEATITALREWPLSGVPDSPRAWLTVVARRKATDLIRREGLRGRKEREATQLLDQTAPEPPEPVGAVGSDDQLRLIFTCCHPTLAPESRVALALRTLCGLDVPEIAAALLTTEAAMAKRLTRTRQKIKQAGIRYRVPAAEELPARLTAVCGVVHGLYTAGHTRLAGESLLDVDLCTEAVRLARLLRELLPDEAQPQALLALLLLTEARRPARIGPDGEPVLLAEQDRSRWDGAAINEGLRLLADSLERTRGQADPYQLQAAIAAQHALAPTASATDWAEIVRLYDLLLSVQPGSTPAALGRAVAVAEAYGTPAGLAALDALDERSPDPHDHRRTAIRAELLARLGHHAEAAAAMRRSLAEPLPAPERAHRLRRIAVWEARA